MSEIVLNSTEWMTSNTKMSYKLNSNYRGDTVTKEEMGMCQSCLNTGSRATARVGQIRALDQVEDARSQGPSSEPRALRAVPAQEIKNKSKEKYSGRDSAGSLGHQIRPDEGGNSRK